MKQESDDGGGGPEDGIPEKEEGHATQNGARFTEGDAEDEGREREPGALGGVLCVAVLERFLLQDPGREEGEHGQGDAHGQQKVADARISGEGSLGFLQVEKPEHAREEEVTQGEGSPEDALGHQGGREPGGWILHGTILSQGPAWTKKGY